MTYAMQLKYPSTLTLRAVHERAIETCIGVKDVSHRTFLSDWLVVVECHHVKCDQNDNLRRANEITTHRYATDYVRKGY